MKGQSLAFKSCVTIKGGSVPFCCIKLVKLGKGGIDFLDIPELIGWHAYFQILTSWIFIPSGCIWDEGTVLPG